MGVRSDIRRLLRLLRPHEAQGHTKIRLGAPDDGGYVVLDDFAGVRAAIGCGVGWNIDFERDLAEKGIAVDLFDHTVKTLPRLHALFRWHRLRVAADAGDDEQAIDLDGIARLCKLSTGSAVLKLDIEGDEWGVLAAASEQTLACFRQIVCELHWLENARTASWRNRALSAMTGLARHFAVVHVHANNYSPMLSLGGLPVPSVLELTFASRTRYALKPSGETFPTPLDRPNNPAQPDFALGAFDYRSRLTALLPWR